MDLEGFHHVHRVQDRHFVACDFKAMQTTLRQRLIKVPDAHFMAYGHGRALWLPRRTTLPKDLAPECMPVVTRHGVVPVFVQFVAV